RELLAGCCQKTMGKRVPAVGCWWDWLRIRFGSARVKRLNRNWSWFGQLLARPIRVQSQYKTNPHVFCMKFRSGYGAGTAPALPLFSAVDGQHTTLGESVDGAFA